MDIGALNWDEHDFGVFGDTYNELPGEFDFATAETERLMMEDWLDEMDREIEEDERRALAREAVYEIDFTQDQDAFWMSVTPGERHKAKDRLIPLGKWWHAWKRGLRQKKETLRTHRNPKALREGKRKFYEQKRSARGYPVLTLAPQEGIRVYLREWTTHELV